jgi:phosphatidate cytidylyltransferase
VLVLAAFAVFLRPDVKVGFAAWMGTTFSAIYVGILGALVRLGQVAPPLPGGAPAAGFGAERGWILLVILLVWSFDTGAYGVGIALGKRKFLSHISPSKSYWGFFGGLAASTAVAVAGLWALGQPPVMGLALGPVIGAVAQAGDLAESMLKRAAGAKDSGGLIPGHGGILDRVDSFIFAAPVAAIFVTALVR